MGRRVVVAALCSAAVASSATWAEADQNHRTRTISLNSVLLDVAQDPPAAIPEGLRLEAAPSALDVEEEVVLVKFPGPVTAAQYAALASAATRVYTYLPYDTYLVKMPAGRRAASRRLRALGARWTGPYQPAYKLSRAVAAVQEDPAASATEAETYWQVMVQIFPDADPALVAEKIRALGLESIVGRRRNPFFSRLRLLLSPEEIARFREDLARLPEVFWIDLEPRKALLNDTTIWVGQSGLSGGQTTPIFSQGIFGQGQTIAVLDTGIDADMCYFRDPARGLPPINACNGGTAVATAQRKVIAVDFLWQSECNGGVGNGEWDTQDHGSHVAGTAAGDNFANLLVHNPGDGMAPGAKLVIQDAGFSTDNCGDLPGIGCPVVDLNPIFLQTYNQGARLHTNSWGDNENAAVQNNYSTASQDVDEFMWNHKDFLIFFAAGNGGPGTGTVGSPSTAKSAVSVGATLRGTSAQSMASFSSCGPTDDGRIKPEVTVPGSSIVSANNDLSVASNNCGTKTSSGTSMAAPGAAGLAALIRQYYTEGWYPGGAPSAADAFTPSAALLRATLVNSAQNTTNTTAIPANCQGWGRVLLENALFFPGQSRRLWVEDDAPSFPTGSTNQDRSFTFTVATGQSFKVTLAWTDFPSTPAANPHLNNDLDLIVTNPAGTTLRGNVFSGGQSASGGSADRRNTLEQVLLASPLPGTYTVTVRSFTVPNGPQPFALVVTGDATEGSGPAPTTVFFDDFETELGWTANPGGTDTASAGRWERGDPQTTSSSGTKQLGTAFSGANDLVTGRLAGSSAGVHDIDGGVTSIQSPPIALPGDGALTLSFAYYLAHGTNSTSADFLRVRVIGATSVTLLQELGAADNDNAVWTTGTADLSAFAGQTVRLLIEAADTAGASLVEAAVDDVRITQQ
jgi:hypothetical protein